MKLLPVLLLLMTLLPAALCSSKNRVRCRVSDGYKLEQFSGRSIPLRVPCKYDAVLQQCGPYKVTLTPDHRYLYPTYIIDSVWVSVNNTETNKFWQGRTTNKIAALYIIKGADQDREAFNKRGGTYNTTDLFTVSNTTKDVTLTEKNGMFSITFGPFDFNGKKNRDSTLEFTCKQPEELTPYPLQFCGSRNGKEFKNRTGELFSNKWRVELTILFDIFNSTSIVQMEEQCIAASHILTQECGNDRKRKEAIKICHLILDSAGHTECVTKYTCDPMKVFVDCMRYVCSGYTDKEACERVGAAIDMCRNFPILTERVKRKNCYTDLLTSEDNPYHGPNMKAKRKAN